MTALICGSFAYDTIMVFPERFRDHVLPEKVHMLNVAFLVPELRREFGGCAGNIAYNLNLLGGRGLPMGTVGHDFAPYARWLAEQQIDTRYVRTIDEAFTAQAYITTDIDDNQITAFHPGAMNFAHRNEVPREGIARGVVAPDGREGMLAHARQFAEAGIPFLFDPGQGLPMFDGEALRQLVHQSNWLALNEYEAAVMQERTGWSLAALSGEVEALVITHGSKGSQIYAGGHCHEIPPVRPAQVADPTGCGDAYRAGLLFGLEQGHDWPTTGRLASLLGSLKVAVHGTQNHRFTFADIARRYRDEFGAALPSAG